MARPSFCEAAATRRVAQVALRWPRILTGDPLRRHASPGLILEIHVDEVITIGARDFEALAVLNELKGCAGEPPARPAGFPKVGG